MSKETETVKKLINAKAFSLGEPGYTKFNELSAKLLADFHMNLGSESTDEGKTAVIFAYAKFCMELEDAMDSM